MHKLVYWVIVKTPTVYEAGQDDQDVFQQADDAQGQEDLGLDEDLLTEAAAALVAEGRGSDVL